MGKYILRDGVISFKGKLGTVLYDVYRRKMILMQYIEPDAFHKMLVEEEEITGYRGLILQALLKRNYIVDSANPVYSICYDDFFV